jgi:hypothetical protein
MLKRFLAVAAAMVVVLALFSGCDNNAEQQRSVITIVSMNCNAPAFSDVIGDLGSLSDTWVPVVFENRPYNALVATQPGSPHGEFIITEYLVEWVSLDGGAVMSARGEQTSFAVPSGNLGGAYIRLVGLNEKVDPILVALQAGGTRTMRANITFTGHESGTERDVDVETSVTVEFANFADDSVELCDLVF